MAPGFPVMKLLTGNVIAVGGGKGGVGKSFFASNLACSLAQRGRVVLVDADLAGANIHILFGIKYPGKTLNDFLKKKTTTFEEILLPTQLPNLRLICGASDILELANPHFAWKQKIIAEIARLNVDTIIIDIGAGASLNNLDFFNAADTGIIVTTPAPTALQNAYGFLKMSVHRRILSLFPGDSAIKHELTAAFGDIDAFKNMGDIFALLERIDQGAAEQVNSLLRDSRYRLVVNMATPGEGERIAKALSGVAYQYLNVRLSSLGAIGYDARVENSIRKMEPILLSNETLLNGAFLRMSESLLADRTPTVQPPGAASENDNVPRAAAKQESSSKVQLCLHDETLSQGKKLHVQTEDLGLEKAQIVTLVFSGGQILLSRKTDYHDLLGRSDVQHSVAEKVRIQHGSMLADIQHGILDSASRDGKGE